MEDGDVLVVDFAKAMKEMKNPWIIVGRYNTKRIFNASGLFMRLRQVWQLHGGMEEKGIGEKRFLIVLEKEGDYKHILKGGLWLYQNDAFLVAKSLGGEKLGEKYLGEVREVGKDNGGHTWASFLRVRVEHDVEKPIRRWIPIAGSIGSKARRFDVKYEGAPHSCFFCGIFGHNERSCLLPEEEKYVRYCEEHRASPFRQFEHRSYYVPADDKKIKRSLHFSPASSGWKQRPESEMHGLEEACNQLVVNQGVEAEIEEVEQRVPEPVQDVLAAAVTNQTVIDVVVAPPIVSDEQVTKACEDVKTQSRWAWQYKRDKNRRGSSMKRAGGPLAQVALGTIGREAVTPVLPILDCLREDGSLYAELCGGAAQIASTFLKKKSQVLGKRPV
ncbi:hypothetical protein ACQ4PT_039158 [Festuca glaucescens]